MKEELLINGFVAFIKNGPDIVDKLNELDLSFPNIPFPTMGGNYKEIHLHNIIEFWIRIIYDKRGEMKKQC